MRIAGSTALVTGSNRGLGASFVHALLDRGATRVYATSRNPVAGDDPRVVALALDVTDPFAIADIARRCGDVDLLINNAGLMRATGILGPDAADAMRQEMDVNVHGLRAMIAAFAPALAANGGGAIIDVLSVVSWFTAPGNATYGASKHAALAISEAARMELRPQGTLVVDVFAGFIDTDMAAAVTTPKTPPAQVVGRALDAVEVGAERALVDERAEQVWRDVRHDPDRLAHSVEEEWRRGGR